MDAWRKKYFPEHLNKLPAHLMLFHSLPQVHLSGKIIPSLNDVASNQAPYSIRTGWPFKLKTTGVAVKCHHHPRRTDSDRTGMRSATGDIHEKLKADWFDFLSDQDRGNIRLHWTVINKEPRQEVVEEALTELKRWDAAREGRSHLVSKRPFVQEKTFPDLPDGRGTYTGTALGLTLWRYVQGNWVEPKNFDFTGEDILPESVDKVRKTPFKRALVRKLQL
ncbi:uncharacterized protein AB675_368 [Cyphellophora attinorum]|uniref:Uncharacterized protein n=1 Tax=Cyphellophora attinorum TaxID=1664694 RepID=A0A0N0NSB7_9EURO|nr:uncharacterized protein AB675_368 [Phialophora attinorum]KPI45819.1 hypothetical protein AB675_368 [Phialophora attinorum]